MKNIIVFWIDDERPMPEGYTHSAKTSDEAIEFLSRLNENDVLDLVSFDHDLGYSLEDNGIRDDTTRRVAAWMSENGVFPNAVLIHSHNPIGAKWLYDFFSAEAPVGTFILRQPYRV